MARVTYKKIAYSDPKAFAIDVYKACLRLNLPPKAAILLTSHICLSTGYGRSVDNWRLAGIKAGNACVCAGTCAATYAGDYTCASGFEYVNGVRVDSIMPFRSYRTLDEGLAAVIALLKGSRYVRSWSYLMAGDQNYYAQLGRDGWYTASTTSVDASCRSIQKHVEAYVVGIKPDNFFRNASLAVLVVGISAAVAIKWL